MHILEIPSFFPPFGGAFCLEQAKALQSRGHEVRILACNELGISVNIKRFLTARYDRWEEEMEGVTVFRTNYRAMPRNIQYNQLHWCKTVVSMYHDYVKQYGKPDVLHAHCCQWAGVAARMISEKENIPFCITEHLSSVIFYNAFGDGWKKNQWARILLAETYRKADMVIPVSKELVDDLSPLFGRDYRYAPLTNIIDTDFFAFKERTDTKGRVFRLCCLAIPDIYRKGYDVLAEAMKGVEGIELHIAGRRTDGKKVRDLFAESDNVVYHGELDKYGVLNLLYDCDALVLASRSEAQGLVILEALSTGIPVVTTDSIPSNAIVEGACLISKTGSANSLRENIIKVCSIKPSPEYHDAVVRMAHRNTVAVRLEHILSMPLSAKK